MRVSPGGAGVGVGVTTTLHTEDAILLSSFESTLKADKAMTWLLVDTW